MKFEGMLYRALNPIYAREPLSGRGAELYGGRFNPKGMPALYTSLSVMTAIREANQVGNLQPTTLVAYKASLQQVFDTRDANLLAAHSVTASALADTSWRDRMRATGGAPTQELARKLVKAGYCGLLVRSFAPGTTERDLNLVLWSWTDKASARLEVVDDEHRLEY